MLLLIWSSIVKFKGNLMRSMGEVFFLFLDEEIDGFNDEEEWEDDEWEDDDDDW